MTQRCVQTRQLGQQLSMCFWIIRIDHDTFHWAHHLTLRLIKMADAFGAPGGVNFVNGLTHGDRLIGANRFAHIAIHTLFFDFE